MEQVRVLHFLSSYSIGITGILVEQACTMVRMAPEAFVFVGGEREQFSGLFRKLDENHVPYRVIRGLDDHKQFHRLVREFTDLVREIKPEYVHAQTNWQLAIAWWARVKTGLRYKILYTIHGYRHNFRLRSYVARVLMGAALAIATERVFVCSAFVRNRFWFLGKKLRILYLGVDASFFDDNAMRQEENFLGIIFSGEFRRGKNQETLIKAVARCMKETDGANLRLYLPGHGAGLEACREIARRLGIARSVVFPGQVDRIGMLELYGKCQIAIVPSNAETFGFCIAEPMVLGLALVSRPVGVALDVISHGRNGFLYRTERELIGLLKMLAGDPDRRKMIGRKAADDSKVFQWETICGQYLEALGIERQQYEDSSAGASVAANVPIGIGDERVAYFVSSYKVGLTITLAECAKSLAKIDPGRFEFISGDREQFPGLHEHLKGHGLHVHAIKGLDEHRHFFLLLKELAGLLRDMNPAIVHVHTNWQLALVALARIRNRAKYRIYYSVHGYRHNHPVNAPIAKYLIGAAVALTCSRVFMASSYLMKEFHFLFRKRMLLYQGVESTFFQEAPPPKQEDTKRVIFAGQFRAGKGQEVVIKALGRYVRETGDTKVALLLPGEGPKRKSCEMLARSLGIGPFVEFPGQLGRQAIHQLYRRCQIAVAPANIETFGYCIAEPFVLGRVVLSRPTGIALDIIKDGESGFLFKNAEELAVLFRRLFSSPETLETVGEKALENRQLLNWDRINRQYLDILREDLPGLSPIEC